MQFCLLVNLEGSFWSVQRSALPGWVPIPAVWPGGLRSRQRGPTCGRA